LVLPRCEQGRFTSLVTLKMDAICFFETSFLTRATRCNISKKFIIDAAVITSQKTVFVDLTVLPSVER
jgi:hypothetical protein